jgi:hypothetical protein
MDDIKVGIFKDPQSLADVYSINVPMFVENRLRSDIIYNVVNSLTHSISNNILKEHGEEMVQTILNKEAEIKDRIINTICKNIEWFAHELMMLQRNFDNKELCQCGQVHGNITRYGEIPFEMQHFFVPMSNLQYLEHRYDRVQKWIKGLNYE